MVIFLTAPYPKTLPEEAQDLGDDETTIRRFWIAADLLHHDRLTTQQTTKVLKLMFGEERYMGETSHLVKRVEFMRGFGAFNGW